MGVGYLESEFEALGVDVGERNALYQDSIDVCRQAWTGKSVTDKGRHVTAPGNTASPTPIQLPHRTSRRCRIRA